MKSALTICQYCQGYMVYSNDESGNSFTMGDTTIFQGVYDECIHIGKVDGEYHLLYADGETDDEGRLGFRIIGEPINFCPSCGRKLK